MTLLLIIEEGQLDSIETSECLYRLEGVESILLHFAALLYFEGKGNRER